MSSDISLFVAEIVHDFITSLLVAAVFGAIVFMYVTHKKSSQRSD